MNAISYRRSFISCVTWIRGKKTFRRGPRTLREFLKTPIPISWVAQPLPPTQGLQQHAAFAVSCCRKGKNWPVIPHANRRTTNSRKPGVIKNGPVGPFWPFHPGWRVIAGEGIRGPEKRRLAVKRAYIWLRKKQSFGAFRRKAFRKAPVSVSPRCGLSIKMVAIHELN